MTFGVFMHKVGSIYDDIPKTHYQFPKNFSAATDLTESS